MAPKSQINVFVIQIICLYEHCAEFSGMIGRDCQRPPKMSNGASISNLPVQYLFIRADMTPFHRIAVINGETLS